jgi:hypothetical protein
MNYDNNDWLDEMISWAVKNRISEKNLPRNKEDLLKLEHLELRNQIIIDIPESIGNCVNLKSLDLSGNKLVKIPESIGNCVNLSYLCLWDNNLVKIPKSIAKLSNLTELDLSYNQLVNIPASIENLINLKELSLYENLLQEIPNFIGELSNLVELDLSKNKLKTIPCSIIRWENLKSLNLNLDNSIIFDEKIINILFHENNDLAVKFYKKLQQNSIDRLKVYVSVYFRIAHLEENIFDLYVNISKLIKILQPEDCVDFLHKIDAMERQLMMSHYHYEFKGDWSYVFEFPCRTSKIIMDIIDENQNTLGSLLDLYRPIIDKRRDLLKIGYNITPQDVQY